MAFRSRIQAEEKAREFREQGHSVLLVKTFRNHYEDACQTRKQIPIVREGFEDMRPREFLAQIRDDQPDVFDELERIHQGLWSGLSFYGGITLLVTTHKAAALWTTSTLTRAWYHPEFDADAEPDEFARLAKDLFLSRMVLDAPEPDDFVEVLPKLLYQFIQEQQRAHRDWHNKPRRERLEICASLPNVAENFERFNELMRLNLATLKSISVDFNAIPFGSDQIGSGIYRSRHGDEYYVGPKPWLNSSPTSSFRTHITVISTERLVCDLAEKALGDSKGRGRPIRL